MYEIKAFIVRILQVIWLLSLFFLGIGYYFAALNSKNYVEVFGVFSVFAVLLCIIQYLIFARFNPNDLFNGQLNQKPISRFLIRNLLIVSVLVGAGLGLVVKNYNKYQFDKQIEEANDLVFYNTLARTTAYDFQKDTSICYDGREPVVSKADVSQRIEQLKSQDIKGLNLVIELEKGNDNIAQSVRCTVLQTNDIKDFVDFFKITY